MSDPRHARAHARSTVSDATRGLASAGDAEGVRRKAQTVLDALLVPTPASTLANVACARGCAMCCHLRVAAMPVEVFGVAHFLQRQVEPAALAATRARLHDVAERIHALPRDQLLTVNIACPLLDDDGACSVYPARPFNCRSYHSLDLSTCRASFDDPRDMSLQHPQSAFMAAVHSGTQEGLRDSLRLARMDTTHYELVTALAEAFEDGDCEHRHAAGQLPFRRAIRL